MSKTGLADRGLVIMARPTTPLRPRWAGLPQDILLLVCERLGMTQRRMPSWASSPSAMPRACKNWIPPGTAPGPGPGPQGAHARPAGRLDEDEDGEALKKKR